MVVDHVDFIITWPITSKLISTRRHIEAYQPTLSCVNKFHDCSIFVSRGLFIATLSVEMEQSGFYE